MEKDLELDELAMSISEYGFAVKQIENIKLNKSLLVAIKKGARGKIMVFAARHGMEEVASMGYTINSKGVYLSKFVVSEELQQCGIGRFMWNLAMAHGDALGKTCIYGEANPTDPIQGVSSEEGVTFKQEQDKIREIYKKLGCTINGESFIRTWKEGEILKVSNEDIKSLVDKIIEEEPIKEKNN